MMLFLVWGILIVAGLLAPKSKTVTGAILAFLVIAIGMRTQGYDYDIYQNEYLWSTFGVYNSANYLGYIYLQLFSHNLRFDYPLHLLLCAVISVALYCLAIFRFTNYRNLVLALFLIYPFAHEAVQVRTFLADAMVLCVIPLLLKDSDNKRQRVMDLGAFFLVAIAATSVHYLAAFYVACAVFYLVIPRSDYTLALLSIIGVACILIVSGVLPRLLAFSNARAAYWLSLRAGLGVILPIGFTLCIWGFSRYMTFRLGQKSDGLIGNRITVSSIGRFCDCLLLLIPLFIFDITFNRLWRIFIVLLYILYATYSSAKDVGSSRERLLVGVSMIALSLGIEFYEDGFTIMASFFAGNGIIG